MNLSIDEKKVLISTIYLRKREIVKILMCIDDLSMVAEYNRESKLLDGILDQLFDD